MSYGLTESQRSSFDISASDTNWWKTDRSSKEIAERLAQAHVDNHTLELRVAELNDEISSLRSRIEARDHSPVRGTGRSEAEFAARERLLKDEFERKLQAFQMDLNRERQQFERQLKKMQERIAGCLCGEFRIEHVDHQAHTKSTGVPERWLIRNSR